MKEKIEIELEKKMQEILTITRRGREFEPLSFDEVVDATRYLDKEREFYRKHKQILANQLMFLASEIESEIEVY